MTYKSLDKIVGGVRLINILPIKMAGASWYCVGFEPEERNLGDNIHLLLMYNKDFKEPTNLYESIQTFFMKADPLIRVHSECLLGEALRSDLCDCGQQLDHAIKSIINSGAGAIIYLRQEGRGIGLRAKLSCLAAQEGYEAGIKCIPKMSPDEANIHNGFKIDEREYTIVPKILKILNISKVSLITGNNMKISSIKDAGIDISFIGDISRCDISVGSRKHIELSEKISRGYIYSDLTL